MESTHTGWWRRHGWTVAILLSAFGISFALRTIWAYPVVSQWGPLFTYAGGSDSYYHSRVMQYIIQNHTNLIHDPLLRFPTGALNPREPLFDWMNAILGIVFAPFFGGNAVVAGAWFLDLQAPLWSALGVFPVYLIGREVSNRQMGLIAAVIFPFLSANIDSSIFGYANYLSFYTFIILVVIYSYIRTVKAVGSRRWVESYRHPSQYVPALRAFLRTERSAVKWAVFTGVSLGTLALAWQGYTYAVVVIAISLVVAMVIERVRRVDSFGLYIATAIVGLVGFPMAMPYYIVQQQFTTWFDLPLLVFFGALALLLPFLLMRDVPWVFSVPFLALLVAAGVGLLSVVSPTAFTNLVTGQGYFVKTLIYSTVAEAQAPSIDQLVLGYGVVTFFLAFAGLAVFVYLLVHGRFKRHHVVFLVFAVISLYLPISAAKFFLIGSPIFALLPAEVLRRALDIAGYGELRRTTASLSDRRSQFSAFRKAFKPRHVLVMVLVVGIVLPNVWVAIDAGIPGNTKAQYAAQVGATLPPWLQLNSSNPSNYYFGAEGTSLDTPDEYDSAGYNWLAQQDTNLPEPQRPAFVSWWDYGFQAIDQGQHPSVADNFQNGIDPAGQFLLSQNESQAIAVLATTLLQAEQRVSGIPDLPPALNRILAGDGLNTNELHNLLVNTSADYRLVVANPAKYLPVNPNTLTDDNAMYLAMAYFLATSLPLGGVAKVYNDIQAYTGWTIRYAMTDSRLFPFSGSDTGIFYAPADLTGRVIDASGEPSTFFNLSIVGSNGQEYAPGQLPSGVTQVGAPVINYFAPFYNSMIYRTYIGYNGTDVGQGAGIPGLSLNSTLEPGWMLQHFQIVYKTAYLCSQPNYGGTCVAENEPAAVANAPGTNGSADTRAISYFNGGETMLEYYPGQTLIGDVQLPNGAPVGGARVTVFDGWGIPHQTVLTSPQGTFSVVLPPGNDTVNVTMGTLQGLSQEGSILLKSIKEVVPAALGLSLDSPSLVQTITVGAGTLQGFVFWKNGANQTYSPPGDTLVAGAQVVFTGPNLTHYAVTTDTSGSFLISNVAPGIYSEYVLYQGRNISGASVTVGAGSTANATVGLRSAAIMGTVYDSTGSPQSGASVTVASASGVVASSTTNGTGTYSIGSVGPGNYTVSAAIAGTDLRAAGVPISINASTLNFTINFTVGPTGQATFVLTSSGAPAAGVALRLTPVASFANASISPLATLWNASRNSTVLVSSGTGSAVATLPTGNYSVYAYGLVNGQAQTAVSEVSVSAGSSSAPTYLALSAASPLSGTVATVGSPSGATETAVIAYGPAGSSLVTWAVDGRYAFDLPSGSYSILALQGTTTSPSGVYAALASVSLPTANALPLAPVTAIRANFTVGETLPSGVLVPATGASVTVRAGPSGPAVPAVTGSDGSVTVFAPSVLPLSAGSYCVSTSAFGFVSTSNCALTPNGLAALTHVESSLLPVSVKLTVVGLPSGTAVQVNLTAESSTAVNRSYNGGPTFTFTLPPGLYGVGARATIGSGTVVYLPPSTLSTTIPVGAMESNLTLLVIPQVNSTGTLIVPSSVPVANATISLSSPLMNLSVNGSAFEKGFYATPGTYSAYATVTAGSTTYTSLTRVTLSASGNVSPTISLTHVGPTLTGNLVNQTGAAVPLNASVRLVSSSGAVAIASAVEGTFSVALNPSSTYAVFVNGTTTTKGPNGSYETSWRSVSGAACTLGTSGSGCRVTLSGVPRPVWVNGSLVATGVPGTLPGSVRLVGPYPSSSVTVVNTTSGTFSVSLAPGSYSLYATGGGGAAQPLSNLTTVVALSSSASPIAVRLAPTWVDTISVVPPSNSGSYLGPITLTVTNAIGDRAIYTGLSAYSSIPIALPSGSYVLRAYASGTLGGVATNASAIANVQIVNGNMGTVLDLAFVLSTAVAGTLGGSSSATVLAGSTATFSFSVRNVGNLPVTVHPVGAPSYWTFSFSLGNVTLTPGPTGNVVSGEVRIQVPAGTPVSHPGVAIQFETANGTVVGSVSPAPVVNVVGYYGIQAGAVPPAEVGSASATIPFFVVDSGNQAETVVATVADSARLANLGWQSNFVDNTSAGVISKTLGPGQNQTFFVVLNATSSIFIPPGSVTVVLSVQNASGAVSDSLTLSVPRISVAANGGAGNPPLIVSGPSIGSPPNSLPDWVIPLLAFVPAIALVVGVITYRWWRTRRWTRR